MDNLSHSLVGLAVGELVQRSFAPEADHEKQGTRRRLLLVAGALACNFPDLDLLLTRLLPDPLGYLLHHRGHTHTLLYAIPQALLLVALLWALWPSARALLRHSPAARKALALTVTAGFVLHMAMDFLNSYGIHPFYPFDARWLFGDMVFILEPVFWVACGLPLAMMPRRPLLRAILAGSLACALAFFTYKGFLHWSSLLGLIALGATLAWLQLRSGTAGRRALLAGFCVAAGFAAVQAGASLHGKDLIAAQLKLADPHSRVMDISMTAYPANPLCWNFVSVERLDQSSAYRLRRGRVALAMMDPDRCPPAFVSPGEPLVEPIAGLRVVFLWESSTSLAALHELDADCRGAAWLRFARAPAIGPDAVTDVRFGEGSNFSTLPLDKAVGQPCPAPIPLWGKPRQDLLTQ